MSVCWCWQQLITATDHRTGLESQINRLQHKLKDVNDEFKSRLQKYVKDIAVGVKLDCALRVQTSDKTSNLNQK